MNINKQRGAFAHFVKSISKDRSITKATLAIVDQSEKRKEDFKENRLKVQDKLGNGARLTKHRITL